MKRLIKRRTLNHGFPANFRSATKYNILHCNYRFPESLGPSAQSFIRCLLQNSVSDRLGGLPADAGQVKVHEFFEGFDWNAAVACANSPPFVPRYTT